MKTRKLVFSVFLILFLFSSFASVVMAEPTTPPTNVPAVSGNQVSGQQPQIPAVNQNQLPGQGNAPVAPPPVPPSTIPSSVDSIPVNVQPPDPSKGFDPTPQPIVPPTPQIPQKETPVKPYQTSWYTSPLFLISMVLLLAIVFLVFYSLREGKAPVEEKEEAVDSKKRKRNSKNGK